VEAFLPKPFSLYSDTLTCPEDNPQDIPREIPQDYPEDNKIANGASSQSRMNKAILSLD
jgi:hypothetical protein